ncbi:diguanylate cyclase [Vibrio furnissii]|uniref:sensor domain-containing diguanylate cyclase n=1 Tax=Vibrio furnissii TaxID=29494 RepID=UPI0023D99609|nr:diguanylate cyclase [Vibrio furnissii]
MSSSFTKSFSQFLIVLFIIGFVPSLYFIQEFNKLDERAIALIEQKHRVKLEFSKHELITTLDEAYTSIATLANNGMFHQTVRHPTPINIANVEDFWLLISRTQGVYSCLRFIDPQGQEQIRVDYQAGKAQILTRDELQNRALQDYFLYGQSLSAGQIGVFGVQSTGADMTPTKPSLYFISPIDLDGERKGYFVANINLNYIYQQIAGSNRAAMLPDILNLNGDVLMSQRLEESNDRTALTNLAQRFPQLWHTILSDEQGTISENGQWFSFVKISPNASLVNVPSVVLLERVENSEIHALMHNSKNTLTLQMVALFALICLIASIFVLWNNNHQKNSIESKLARAAMNGMSAVIITDRNNRIIKVNNEFTRLSGYSFEEVSGQQPSMFASGKHTSEFYVEMWQALQNDGFWEGEVINQRKDGSMLTEILRIQTILDDDDIIQFYVASFVDITERKLLEDQLRDQSEKDGLSNIWNRRKFDQEFRSECMRIKRYPAHEQSCLAILDIDHFKRINDKYGHARGDKTIRAVAQCLRNELRESDFLARIGGEEFAIILPHTPIDEAETVLNRLRVAVFDLHQGDLSVSGGLTDITEVPEEVYQRADMALYESKESGRNVVSVLTSAEMVHFA